MSSLRGAMTLMVPALAIACQPTARSNADTTKVTTSSSTAQTTGAATATDTGAAAAGAANNSAGGSKTAKPTASTTKSTVKSGAQTKKPPVGDPTIIGHDSVIRFPLKTLPTASSSPVRK